MSEPAGANARQVPIDPKLFEWPSTDPHLIGSRCKDCGTHYFPAQSSCSRCFSEDVEKVPLAKRGKLWSFTIQGFLPKSPPYAGEETQESFKPYGVGYIELPGQVRVESRLQATSPEELEIGMEMELVFVPFREDAEGNELITYAFAPVQ